MPTAFMSMLPRPCATGLLRPKRLFEVDGTTGGAPSSHCGLEARGDTVSRPPPRQASCLSRPDESYKGDRRRRWRGHGPELTLSRPGSVRQERNLEAQGLQKVGELRLRLRCERFRPFCW